jgi:hypothetical protein
VLIVGSLLELYASNVLEYLYECWREC